MAAIGMNVAADGRHTPESLQALHCSWARLVARQERDLSEYLAGLQAVGIRVLLVFDRLSVEQFGTPATAFEFYDHHYGLLVDAFEVGNEPDLESPSSWTMTPAGFIALGRTARQALPHRLLVAGGMASGQPSYLTGQDIGWCDAIAVHPYLKDMTRENDLSDVDELVAAYQQLGKPIWITEWGWWGDDEERGAAEIADVVTWAASTDQIGAYFHFCADDAMVAPFGLYRADGTPKPAVEAFARAAAGAHVIDVVTPTPDPPLPAPEPVPVHTDDGLPAQVLAPLDAAYAALWRAVDPSIPLAPDSAFYKAWRANHRDWGSPVSGEIPDDDGTVLMTFSLAGPMRWTGGNEVVAA